MEEEDEWEQRLTVHRKIIWVFARRAALLQLFSGWQVFGQSIGSVERVHVRNVSPRKDDGIDVFAHERFVFNISQGGGRTG